jgi:CRISPR-associated protein Csx3
MTESARDIVTSSYEIPYREVEMERFPAILIGGPPHSGKSVLTYSLTQALRQRGVEHYVVRAAPDGEGDWANEAAQKLVRTLRVKGDFTPAFIDFVCRSVTERHLPLLVDAGGLSTPEQERIFDCCTHAALLTPDEPSRVQWRAIAERNHLPILAELTSHLHGECQITDAGPTLRGVITGLDRSQTAAGPVFDALVQRLAVILGYDPDELYRLHESLCPVETVIYLARLARTFGVPFDGEKPRWQPNHVRQVLDYLPEATSLGLYDRGPNWLYVAVALQAAPASFFQFDPRLGWVQAIPLRLGTPGPNTPLQIQCHPAAGYVHLESQVPAAHLDYSEFDALTAPPIPAGTGVVLSGKLPLWVYTSLALTYRAAPWIAAYQPQLNCAVVAYSAGKTRAAGDCIYDLPS